MVVLLHIFMFVAFALFPVPVPAASSSDRRLASDHSFATSEASSSTGLLLNHGHHRQQALREGVVVVGGWSGQPVETRGLPKKKAQVIISGQCQEDGTVTRRPVIIHNTGCEFVLAAEDVAVECRETEDTVNKGCRCGKLPNAPRKGVAEDMDAANELYMEDSDYLTLMRIAIGLQEQGGAVEDRWTKLANEHGGSRDRWMIDDFQRLMAHLTINKLGRRVLLFDSVIIY